MSCLAYDGLCPEGDVVGVALEELAVWTGNDDEYGAVFGLAHGYLMLAAACLSSSK